jgi:hypothetical protein
MKAYITNDMTFHLSTIGCYTSSILTLLRYVTFSEEFAGKLCNEFRHLGISHNWNYSACDYEML